ncbi:ATP-binding cassette domain-containing protein [Microbacterium sp. NPDC096154]|uniref:ATP-binding cassette domain-containing protein n=1 Tax=Microbacterium sp. NPDC096154 TaxID=3155549 RepID=UPI00332C09ED
MSAKIRRYLYTHERERMADGKVLEFRGLTKIFGDVAAVSDFTARVEPGVVTGFVGPNGAGKSTTLRMLLGEVRPTAGTALIGGVPYAKLAQPRREVGSLLENPPYRLRRTAEKHLHLAARAVGAPASRVGEVLEVVGLGAVGGMRIGSFSLGMRQRLGVAEALLGDPGVLVFDEPANGLDPEGIRWMRLLMRRLADEGRTVLMSSHVLSEVQQVADNILIISNGRLLFSGGIEQLADVDAVVMVDSPNRAALRDALRARGIEFEVLRSGINVTGVTTADIGTLAAEAGVPLSSLQLKQHTLEDVFLKIVNGTWHAPPPAASDEAQDDPHGAGDDLATDDVTDDDVPPMPDDVVEGRHVDDAGAQIETVDELPFVPTTVDTEVMVDPQPVASVLGDSKRASDADPLEFLNRPLWEIEKDVVAGEAELIAASPEGEQPTPGWLPVPEDVPSPAEEDADDPDALETPDAVIDLPRSEPVTPADADDEFPAEEPLPGVGVAAPDDEDEALDDGPAAEQDEHTAAADEPDAAEVDEQSDAAGEDQPDGRSEQDEAAAQDDAPDESEDEMAPHDDGRDPGDDDDVEPLPEVEASVDELKPRPASTALGDEHAPFAASPARKPWPGLDWSAGEDEDDEADADADDDGQANAFVESFLDEAEESAAEAEAASGTEAEAGSEDAGAEDAAAENEAQFDSFVASFGAQAETQDAIDSVTATESDTPGAQHPDGAQGSDERD